MTYETIKSALDEFVASALFPGGACVLLSIWALYFWFWSKESKETKAYASYLETAINTARDNTSSKFNDLLADASKVRNLGVRGVYLSSAYASYSAGFAFSSTEGGSGSRRAIQPAELSFSHLASARDHLSRGGDQIIRTALFLTFAGIAYGLFTAVSLIADSGQTDALANVAAVGITDAVTNVAAEDATDVTSTVGGIKTLLATASAKFIISAVGLGLAILMRIADSHRSARIERLVAELCRTLDERYLAKVPVADAELEAANHLIQSVGERFNRIGDSISDLIGGFAAVSEKVQIWHDIAAKIVAERYHYQLGPDPQSDVEGRFSEFDRLMAEHFCRLSLLDAAQRQTLEGFATALDGFRADLVALSDRLREAPPATRQPKADAMAAPKAAEPDR